MNRRTLLRGAGAMLGGGAATAAGLAVTSDDATAEAATTLDVAGDRTLLDDGQAIAAVVLALDVEWSYWLPEGVQPSTVVVEIAAAEAGDELAVVETAESAELFLEASGEESVGVDLVGEGVLDADGLTPEAGERETPVDVESRLRVENASGEVLASATAADTAPITIEREALNAGEYGSIGGSGTPTVEREE